MRSTNESTPLAWITAFLLGACTTVAVQSSATTEAAVPEADSEGEPEAESTEAPQVASATVIPLESAPRATAPNGKASITHLALGDNAYLGKLRMDANGAVPVHRDPTEEFIHVLSGAGTITIDGEAYEVGPGATIYMPANAEVSYQNGDEEMVALQVFAGPEPAAKYDAWTPASP